MGTYLGCSGPPLECGLGEDGSRSKAKLSRVPLPQLLQPTSSQGRPSGHGRGLLGSQSIPHCPVHIAPRGWAISSGSINTGPVHESIRSSCRARLAFVAFLIYLFFLIFISLRKACPRQLCSVCRPTVRQGEWLRLQVCLPRVHQGHTSFYFCWLCIRSGSWSPSAQLLLPCLCTSQTPCRAWSLPRGIHSAVDNT